MLELSVVIVNYNSSELCARTIRSLRKNTEDVELDIMVVNNGEVGFNHSSVRTIIMDNQGFGAACNLGINMAKYDSVLILNPDAIVTHFPIEQLEKVLAIPNVGIVAPKVIENGSFINMIRKIPTPVYEIWREFSGWPHPVLPIKKAGPFKNGWVSGAAFIIRRQVVTEIGGFDERFFLYYEDVDLCLRLTKQGYLIYYLPDFTVEHVSGGSSTGMGATRTKHRLESKLKFLAKYASKWQWSWIVIAMVINLFLKVGASYISTPLKKKRGLYLEVLAKLLNGYFKETGIYV